MPLFTLDELDAAADRVRTRCPATPQYLWPLLAAETGLELWIKHENHTPIGAFKARGGITFIDWLTRTHPDVRGIATATRGNHGQAQARAASAVGLISKIFVPVGNSVEKNAAMRAFGADVIEFGDKFDIAKREAARVAEAEGLFSVPPFHREIVRGVASYALELFAAVQDLDVVYVPIGCGSGACSVITVRDLLGLRTQVVGVVSTEAQGAKLSFEAGRIISTDTAATFADGVAVAEPIPEAFEIYSKGLARVVAVSDDEVAEAIRLIYRTTHNLAEGAGAAPVAAAVAEADQIRGKRAAAILCGGNIDAAVFRTVLSGATPRA